MAIQDSGTSIATNKTNQLGVAGNVEQFTFEEYRAHPEAFAGAPDEPPLITHEIRRRRTRSPSTKREATKKSSKQAGLGVPDEKTATDSASSTSSTSSDSAEEYTDDEGAYSSDDEEQLEQESVSSYPQHSAYGSRTASLGPSSISSRVTNVRDKKPPARVKLHRPDLSPMQAVEFELNETLGEKGVHSVTFLVHWYLNEYYEKQMGGKSRLGEILTLTGSSENAIEATCEDYIREIWGDTSPCHVLQLVEAVLRVPGGQISEHFQKVPVLLTLLTHS